MKEVKKRKVKKDFELDIVNLLKKGLNPAKIAIHLGISMPNLSYYLSSLKKQAVIKKLGYGTWQVIPSGEVKLLSHKASLQVKNVRGHAFIWKIKVIKKVFDWKTILEEREVPHIFKGIAKTPRAIINGRKVWFGKNYITIFEPKENSFFANNPIESKKDAVYEMIEVVEAIKSNLGIEFKYHFRCRRQHYGFINSQDAMHFIKKGKKILIKNEKGYWFSIDFSQNKYLEAETIHEKDADVDGMGYQRLMNSHEKTNFKVTPEFILTTMNGIQQNQQVFAENMKSHIKAIQDLGAGVRALTSAVKTKKSIKPKSNQTSLDRFIS